MTTFICLWRFGGGSRNFGQGGGGEFSGPTLSTGGAPGCGGVALGDAKEEWEEIRVVWADSVGITRFSNPVLFVFCDRIALPVSITKSCLSQGRLLVVIQGDPER